MLAERLFTHNQSGGGQTRSRKREKAFAAQEEVLTMVKLLNEWVNLYSV
jgi:hypothetical protein